jgi:hypothetical protein
MKSNQRECSEQPVATQSGGDGASGQPDALGRINNHQNATGSPPVTNQGQETSLMEDLKQIANYLTEKRAPNNRHLPQFALAERLLFSDG